MIVDQNPVRKIMDRLNLDYAQTAEMFGVSEQAIRSWISGTRGISKSTERMVFVLNLIETLAPNIHANLIPERKTRPIETRGRPKLLERPKPVSDSTETLEKPE